jgi:hypothetical protein
MLALRPPEVWFQSGILLYSISENSNRDMIHGSYPRFLTADGEVSQLVVRKLVLRWFNGRGDKIKMMSLPQVVGSSREVSGEVQVRQSSTISQATVTK